MDPKEDQEWNRISTVTPHFSVGTHWLRRRQQELSWRADLFFFFKPGTAWFLENLLIKSFIYGDRLFYF